MPEMTEAQYKSQEISTLQNNIATGIPRNTELCNDYYGFGK